MSRKIVLDGPSEPGCSFYSRLNSAGEQIRLCRVSRGNDNDPIHCWLTTTTLSKAGWYRCLSYAWGLCKPENRKHIYVNSNIFPVTPNLYYALRRLRRNYADKPLWIDALCINQNDRIEQDEQVCMMGRIYKRSNHLLVFLGDPLQPRDDALGDALVLQTDVSSAIEFFELLKDGMTFHKLPYFSKCPAPKCPSSRKKKAEKPWAAVLEAITVLTQADWFNRTWTIQEIVLAEPATVIYGEHSFPWDLLVTGWHEWNAQLRSYHSHCIMTLSKAEYELLRGFSGKVLDLMWAHHSLRTGEPLVLQLLKFRSKKVSNPRDKIYGLLGLQSGPRAVPVIPDSNAPVEKVFEDFASSLISSQGWIVPLHLDLTHGSCTLPSWVPDWEYSDHESADYAVAQFRAASTYKSSHGLNAKPKVHADMTLEVLGIQIDTIAKMSALSCRVKATPLEQIDLIYSWLHFEQLPKHASMEYIGGGKLRDAHLHSLFADRIHDNTKCTPLKQSDIDEWCHYLEDTRCKLRKTKPGTTYGVSKTMSSHMFAAYRRRLFMTSSGYIGLCPENCQAGDKVFVLSHCPAPIFLRPRGLRPGDNKYTALGHGYVHGIMNGEAVKMGLPLQQVMII